MKYFIYENDQKNSIYPSVPFSCMFEQLTSTVYDNLNRWYLKCLVWSSNLNLVFKPTPFNLLLVALAQSTAYCHVMIMHHIVASHWLCSSLFAGNCPLSVDDVPTMRSMTPMKNYTIFRSARQAKPACSFRYNPTLALLLSFIALGQQWFKLLLAAVAEPLYPLHDLSLPQ